MDEKEYFDTDGNKRSLNWMTRNEPEWAANGEWFPAIERAKAAIA